MATFGGGIYLNTRVSMFSSRLLDDEQIAHLSRLGLDDIVKGYSLAALQDGNLAASIKLRAVESALINVVLSELLILIRPMYGEARELVTHWARKFELFNLKALIRGKLNGLKEAEIRATLHDLPPYLALPHQTLLRTESVLELLRQLEKGQYRAIASQARKSYEEHREPFLLESAIDQRYCSGMVKRARHLSIFDRSEAIKVVGLHLDRISLLWLLRYRFTYRLPPSEAYYQIAHSPRHMFRDRLLALVNMPNWERVIEALPDQLARDMVGADSIAEVERRMHVITATGLRNIITYSPSAVARALAYLILRDLDLKRVFTVVQGRLLDLDDNILQQALGLQPPDAAQARMPLTARAA